MLFIVIDNVSNVSISLNYIIDNGFTIFFLIQDLSKACFWLHFSCEWVRDTMYPSLLHIEDFKVPWHLLSTDPHIHWDMDVGKRLLSTMNSGLVWISRKDPFEIHKENPKIVWTYSNPFQTSWVWKEIVDVYPHTQKKKNLWVLTNSIIDPHLGMQPGWPRKGSSKCVDPLLNHAKSHLGYIAMQIPLPKHLISMLII